MSRSASRMLLRCTSVGWAVSTGDTKLSGERVGNGLGRNASPAQAGHGDFNAAFLGITGTLVDGTAADVVAVFGQVGEVRKIGECADHADRLVARQALEQLFEGLVGFLVGIRDGRPPTGCGFFRSAHKRQHLPAPESHRPECAQEGGCLLPRDARCLLRAWPFLRQVLYS